MRPLGIPTTAGAPPPPLFATAPATADTGASDLLFATSNNLGSSASITVLDGVAVGQRLTVSLVNKRHANDVVLMTGANIAEVNLTTAGDTASYVWTGSIWLGYQLTGTAAYNV